MGEIYIETCSEIPRFRACENSVDSSEREKSPVDETLRYETWDVFTDRRFAGNPLAVIFGADVLSGDAMLRITREFNYSESVFLLTPRAADCIARLRIFTPGGELPFAGHPTVGAAAAIARQRGQSDEMVLELPAGRFRVRVAGQGDVWHAEFENPNLPAVRADGPDALRLEAALGLPEGSVATESHMPRRCGAGIDFFYAAAPLAAVKDARLNTAAWDALSLDDACGVLLYAPAAPGSGADWHVRMFGPHIGVPEDPATGSAAAGLPAQLMASGELADGSYDWWVEQGIEMGRPARIRVRFEVRSGRFESLAIGGDAVAVCAGEVRWES